MSQTIRRVGRPPAARREWPIGANAQECCAKDFKSLFGVDPADSDLVWRLPFRKIVEGIQTVGGIAELARVDRKTVYRRKIFLGGLMALHFIIDRWRGTARPLVNHIDPMHPLNFGRRLQDHYWTSCTVLDVVAACQSYFQKGVRTVKTSLMKPGNPVHEKEAAISKRRRDNWKRKHKISPDVNPEFISDHELRDFQNRKRLGQTYFYHPPGRVTVKMICSKFNVPRREFYRWKAGLLVAERKLLESSMTREIVKQRAAGQYEEPHYDFDYDEIDRRLRNRSNG